jgi:hypothetical protein
MAKTPPKPTGNRIQDLINIANSGDKYTKISVLIRLRESRKKKK